MRAIQASILPKTSCGVDTGKVIRNSTVPERRSSLHILMVSDETRKMRSKGIHSKSGRTSEIFLAKNCETQKNKKRFMARKTPRKRNATGEEK
jgi:hypothetical protein